MLLYRNDDSNNDNSSNIYHNFYIYIMYVLLYRSNKTATTTTTTTRTTAVTTPTQPILLYALSPRAEFQFRHNVCGRRMYAEGTADAVEFLVGKAAAGADKRVYNMVDVLREGGM